MGPLDISRGRRIAAAVALTTALGATTLGALAPPSAIAQTRSTDGTISSKVCDYDWQQGTYQVRQLIRCAARHWPVTGGPDKAIRVARCESHFDPSAYNPAGYLGVFQQARVYWPDRADHYGFDGRSAYNGRANVVVSIRMAHSSGWSAWGCA
jgi:hypothetical protein